MHKNIIDIFNVNKKSINIFECSDFANLNYINNNYKKITDMSYNVYIYNNLFLIINTNDNSKKCESIENIENKIVNGKIISKSIIKELDINSFPFIDKYHDIIKRQITLYQNGISIVNEISESGKSGKSVTFIRIENNQNEFDKIINFIK